MSNSDDYDAINKYLNSQPKHSSAATQIWLDWNKIYADRDFFPSDDAVAKAKKMRDNFNKANSAAVGTTATATVSTTTIQSGGKQSGGNLKFGDKILRKTTDFSFSDPHVAQLQEILGIKVDGKFSSGTEMAVIEYQVRNGLEADGIVGADTFAVLLGGKTAATPSPSIATAPIAAAKETAVKVVAAGVNQIPTPVKNFWGNMSATGQLVTAMLGLIGVMGLVGRLGKK